METKDGNLYASAIEELDEQVAHRIRTGARVAMVKSLRERERETDANALGCIFPERVRVIVSRASVGIRGKVGCSGDETSHELTSPYLFYRESLIGNGNVPCGENWPSLRTSSRDVAMLFPDRPGTGTK